MMLNLYRKVIPKISHDVVRFLRSREYAEIEDTQVIEAELDLSTVMVDYMNKEDRINQEAKAGLQRRHLSPDRYAMVKKSIAEVREFPLANDGIDFVTTQVLEALFDSGNVEEIYGSDDGSKRSSPRSSPAPPRSTKRSTARAQPCATSRKARRRLKPSTSAGRVSLSGAPSGQSTTTSR